MSQVRRLAVALLAVFACASPACSDSDTVMALTINPDQDEKGLVLSNIKVTVTPSNGSPQIESLTPTPPSNDASAAPSFYKRYVLNGVTKVHVLAEAFVAESSEVVQKGETDVTLEEATATAAAVNLESTLTPVPPPTDGGLDSGTEQEAGTPDAAPEAGTPDAAPEAAPQADSAADVAADTRQDSQPEAAAPDSAADAPQEATSPSDASNDAADGSSD